MKRRIYTAVLVVVWLFLAAPLKAQTAPAPTPTPLTATFTVNAKAIGAFSGNTEIAATDVGATLQLTTNFLIRSDNIVSADGQAFLNGVQYNIPLAKLLKGTTLDPNKFQFYVLGQAGVARTSATQAFSGSFGGGLNYDPASTSHFGVNVFEVRYVTKLPGPTQIAGGTVVSSGINLTF